MPSPQPQPSQQNVLDSLSAAADAARQAYLAALAASPPGTDLSALYAKEMDALDLWSDAEDKALSNDPAVGKAKSKLDKAIAAVRQDTTDFKAVATTLSVVTDLVAAATSIAAFFA